MTAIKSGYRSISLLADLNWDRLLYGGTIIFALTFGSFIGTLMR